MSAPKDSKQNTPDPWEVVRKLGQDLAGGLKEMLEALSSLTSTSSLTPTAIASPSMTGNRSNGKPSETAESHASSSSAPSEALNFTWLQQQTTLDFGPMSQPVRKPIQRTRSVSVVLEFETFGTEEQKLKTAQSMLKTLRTKGYRISHIECDGVPLQ